MGMTVHVVRLTPTGAVRQNERQFRVVFIRDLEMSKSRDLYYFLSDLPGQLVKNGILVQDPPKLDWGDTPDFYVRPADFAKARAWVDQYGLRGEADMYTRALDAMEADPNLWVYASV